MSSRRKQYDCLLNDEKRRRERNVRLLAKLENIEKKAAFLQAKTDRIKSLKTIYKDQFEKPTNVYPKEKNYKQPYKIDTYPYIQNGPYNPYLQDRDLYGAHNPHYVIKNITLDEAIEEISKRYVLIPKNVTKNIGQPKNVSHSDGDNRPFYRSESSKKTVSINESATTEDSDERSESENIPDTFDIGPLEEVSGKMANVELPKEEYQEEKPILNDEIQDVPQEMPQNPISELTIHSRFDEILDGTENGLKLPEHNVTAEEDEPNNDESARSMQQDVSESGIKYEEEPESRNDKEVPHKNQYVDEQIKMEYENASSDNFEAPPENDRPIASKQYQNYVDEGQQKNVQNADQNVAENYGGYEENPQYDQSQFDQNVVHDPVEYAQAEQGQQEYDQRQQDQVEYDQSQYVQNAEYPQGQLGQAEYDQGQYMQNAEYPQGQQGQAEYDQGRVVYDQNQYVQNVDYDPNQPSQVEYDPTQQVPQEYDPNQQSQVEYDPSQQVQPEYDQSQVEYDPTQPVQPEYDQSQVEYTQGQAEYDQNQEGQVDYDQSQNQQYDQGQYEQNPEYDRAQYEQNVEYDQSRQQGAEYDQSQYAERTEYDQTQYDESNNRVEENAAPKPLEIFDTDTEQPSNKDDSNAQESDFDFSSPAQ